MPPETGRFDRLLTKYGPIAAIAVFLVYWMASDVSGDIRAVKDALGVHASETSHYLYQICVNTAKDEWQRAACRR